MGTLSDEQFKQLLEAMNTSAATAARTVMQDMRNGAVAPAQHVGMAAVVGQMPPCNMTRTS